MTIANDNNVYNFTNMEKVEQDMAYAIAVCKQNRAILKALDTSMETLQHNLLKYQGGLTRLDGKVAHTHDLATSLSEVLA